MISKPVEPSVIAGSSPVQMKEQMVYEPPLGVTPVPAPDGLLPLEDGTHQAPPPLPLDTGHSYPKLRETELVS